MPRTTNQLRYRVFLPAETQRRLASLAHAEQTPLAEIIRRLCDLATTFDFPHPAIPITPDPSAPTPFTFYISEPLLDRTLLAASTRDLTLDELLSAAATVYLAKRAKTQRAKAA